MKHAVVGEAPLGVSAIVHAIENSSSISALLQNWRKFGYQLGLSSVKLLDFERRLNLGTLQYDDILREELMAWKAAKGQAATLKALYEAVNKTGVHDIAESIRSTFFPPINFDVQGKLYLLDELLGECNSDFKDILRNFVLTSPNQPIRLLKNEVFPSKQRGYYISRSISHQTKVEAKILTSNSMKEHIFLVQGLKKSNQAKATGYQPIDISGNQLDHVSVRVILLESEEDFDIICQRTTKPVHLLEYKNKSYYWLKSSRNVETLQPFIAYNQGNCFDELGLLKKITTEPGAICISDSPGMGKTLLLANLATKIIQYNPHTLSLFIVLQEFTQRNYQVDSISSAVQALVEYSASDKNTRIILEKMLLGGTSYKFHLFLDGYDEVRFDKIQIVDGFLRNIQSLKNIKITVTTRPHFKKHLESILKLLSYEIMPFAEEDQINFLVKYWILQHGAKEGDLVKTFAKECLSALQTNMADYERKIAGIPLQCRMLAEVYAKDAVRASKMNPSDTMTKPTVKINSFFEMYKSLINVKFSRMADHHEVAKQAHIYDSIALLFPNWVSKFSHLNNKRTSIYVKELYSIGLIEESPETGTSRFVHRTFAEFLLAEYLVEHMYFDENCVKLIFQVIFGENGVKSTSTKFQFYQHQTAHLKLKYPVISYFIDMHLQNFAHDTIGMSFMARHCNIEDLCVAVKATSCHGLDRCFDLAVNLLLQNDLLDKDDLMVSFSYLPHAVVDCCKSNVSFSIKVLDTLKQKFGAFLGHTIFDPVLTYDYEYPWIPNCTPLHIAVYHGSYNVVTYLLQQYNDKDITNAKFLLHLALRGSATNNEGLIEDKLSIIDLIVTRNRTSLEERFEDVTPILQENVHFKLLQKLVKVGANINAYSKTYGTILHQAEDKNTYTDLVRWAMSKGFSLINHRDRYKRTPLIRAIGRFGQVDDEVLQLFHKAGADFNAANENGESVLFYALSKGDGVDLEFIAKILDYRAKVNHTNKDKQNAAHVVVAWNTLTDSKRVLQILEMLNDKGFSRFYQLDSDGKTPWQYASEMEDPDEELLDYLRVRKTTCGCALVLMKFRALKEKS